MHTQVKQMSILAISQKCISHYAPWLHRLYVRRQVACFITGLLELWLVIRLMRVLKCFKYFGFTKLLFKLF